MLSKAALPAHVPQHLIGRCGFKSTPTSSWAAPRSFVAKQQSHRADRQQSVSHGVVAVLAGAVAAGAGRRSRCECVRHRRRAIGKGDAVGIDKDVLEKELLEDEDEAEAVGLPAELMDAEYYDAEAEGKPNKFANLTDEELIEDEPAKGQNVGDIVRKQAEEAEKEKTKAEQDAPSRRGNVEITRLFKEQCDSQNLLDVDGLFEISEIKEMLDNDEVDEEELEEIWDSLPKVGSETNLINILAFRDFLRKLDDLFEYDDEDESAESAPAASAPKAPTSTAVEDEEEEEEEEVPLRDPEEVKTDLLKAISEMQAMEDAPMGLQGREITDEVLEPLVEELENSWYGKFEDINDFDPMELLGEWELIYNTSGKLRRWQTLLNANGDIKDGKCVEIIQNFAVDDSGLEQEYDIEEVVEKDGEELSMRGIGAWNCQLSENVISGRQDVLVRLNVKSVEYDTPEGEVKEMYSKSIETQILRTFNYSFIAYMDKDIRIMRPGLTGASIFIFQKIADVEGDEE
mmetsp:Transcript_5400/g.11951  ORF Transcript_5400/g.11951 Transcript_5400/m.11951 type:complete len:515 (-) Transcript_5400:15-1559(-)